MGQKSCIEVSPLALLGDLCPLIHELFGIPEENILFLCLGKYPDLTKPLSYYTLKTYIFTQICWPVESKEQQLKVKNRKQVPIKTLNSILLISLEDRDEVTRMLTQALSYYGNKDEAIADVAHKFKIAPGEVKTYLEQLRRDSVSSIEGSNLGNSETVGNCFKHKK